MGKLFHLLWLVCWVLPAYPGNRTAGETAASSHPARALLAFQSFALYCSDPLAHFNSTAPWPDSVSAFSHYQYWTVLEEVQGTVQGKKMTPTNLLKQAKSFLLLRRQSAGPGRTPFAHLLHFPLRQSWGFFPQSFWNSLQIVDDLNYVQRKDIWNWPILRILKNLKFLVRSLNNLHSPNIYF